MIAQLTPSNDINDPGKGYRAALGILVLSLGMTLLGWLYTSQEARQVAQLNFDFRSQDVVDDIQQHMLAYEQVLRGAVGFILADEEPVNRKQWSIYANVLNTEKNYPGIQGMGFSVVVDPRHIDQFVAAVRAEGFPDFKINPDHHRDYYTAILFLEPFRDRNLRAFGYDMFTNPVRHEAMVRSRDQGVAALSGKVTLVQETSKDVQAGCLLYVPLYQKGMLVGTPEERSRAIAGWVYAPFRMEDLMYGILLGAFHDLRIEVYDGTGVHPDQLMFDSESGKGAKDPPKFANTIEMSLFGHAWTLRVTSLPAFNNKVDATAQRLALAGGLIISLLLFGIALSLARTRAHAYLLAARMTSAHRESERKLQAVFDSVGEGIVTLNTSGVITSANPAAHRIFGYAPGDLVGESASTLSPVPVFSLSLGREGPDGSNVVDGAVEIPGKRANGEEFPMDVTWGGTLLEEERLITLIVRDISERKRLDKLKSEFVSVVSHELRTPLTSIRGALGLVLGGVAGAVTEKGKELLGVAVQNVERLILLINDILDIEKIETGRMQSKTTPVKVDELLRKAVVANEQFASRYDIAFVIQEPLSEVIINGDEDRLMQMLTNLLSNAVKFSSPGSQVEIGSRALDGRVLLSVADHGQGIPLEFRDKVFEKFSQADSSDSRQKGGSGLGLAITKAIVERHGGRIWFDSSISEGTVFHVELPSAEQQNQG